MAILRFEGRPGIRLDQFLHQQMPEHSRARIQDWIKSARVRVDGGERKASYELKGGEAIEVEPSEPKPLRAEPEEIPLHVLYEDDAVIAIDKPAGMVVHSGAGVSSGTLVNALLGRFGTLSEIGGESRPGIVHRLDKDTSGVILVARTDAAHRDLAAQFAAREVKKTYLALVEKVVQGDHGKSALAIARDPVRRTRMTTRLRSGRAASTTWHVERRFRSKTLLRVDLGTGRTHQIRVHLAAAGHPVVGDVLYGAPQSPLGRFFLHAHRIEFTSPATGEPVVVVSPLASELESFLSALE